MSLFNRRSQQQVGIDIGTSSIKAVELEKGGSHPELVNYGIVDGLDFFRSSSASGKSSKLKMSEKDIAVVLKRLLDFTGIKAQRATLSIPVFSSFLTVINLPQMEQKDLERAVSFQARSYIPVSLSEVVLDWIVVPGSSAEEQSSNKSNQNQKEAQTKTKKMISVLLVAVPKEVVTKYERIADRAGLTVEALESESFSLVRSLIGNDPVTTMLVDFGARSTTLSLVDESFVHMSHTVDLSGRDITKAIARGLDVSLSRAEELKKNSGLSSEGAEHGVKELIVPLLNKLIGEFEKMSANYLERKNKEIEKVVLTGGSAALPGLVSYLSDRLGAETIIGDPFARIKHPKKLEPVIKQELATNLAVATGLAMRNL